jgi:molybdopterin synthase sulfur carrier subunit
MNADPTSIPGSKLPTITIKVLYFAAASTETGLSEEIVELPVSDASASVGNDPVSKSGPDTDTTTNAREADVGFPLSALGAFLTFRHKDTKLGEVLRSSNWSVGDDMVGEDEVGTWMLKGGEDVGVICPVSGG